MEILAGFGQSFIAFLVLLTVLVFVHEMGHFLVARYNGVRVEVFSIGFGPEIFGWTDKTGTRWKFSWVPLGGYVKMFGDADVTSFGEADDSAMSEAERAQSFHNKRLGQRAAIVFAGPAINYVFAVIVWGLLFAFVGETFTPAEISAVRPGSVADEAGLQPGDVIVSADGEEVERFEDVQQVVRLSPGVPIEVVVERDGRQIAVTVTPTVSEIRDDFGNTHRVGLLGVTHHIPPVIGAVSPGSAAEEAGLEIGDVIRRMNGAPIEHFGVLSQIVRQNPGKPVVIEFDRGAERQSVTVVPAVAELTDAKGQQVEIGRLGVGPQRGERRKHGPFSAVTRAVEETIIVTKATFKAIGQMFEGTRTTEELGGPIRIAQMSGQMAQGGLYSFVWFMAFISLNLCIINLFPVPMLDGGHLLFYAIEALRGRPLGQKAQEYGFRIGLALVLSLMVFVTWNDLVNLRVVEFIKNLMS